MYAYPFPPLSFPRSYSHRINVILVFGANNVLIQRWLSKNERKNEREKRKLHYWRKQRAEAERIIYSSLLQRWSSIAGYGAFET